ncbi:MAG TPA: FtsQ-type POTRA domain-containing protein [Segeticoccus sp.]|uniref:cell division protein FtsQ/DivIB n=1 Tax=Segeticoccus sp. TaxID=2706531 RepID=UPI002D7F320C|nr:FtsQ-type POTRA domain-containing protein [Segeticoccus sp.]HET8599684.1 FtsQ-type POTRA domain-containing protein [Segeticoccus sp.]
MTREDTVRLAREDFRKRRRSRWLRRLRPWLLLLVVLGVLATCCYAVFFSSWLAARQVRVAGLDGLSRSRVVATARVPLGTPLARVDLGAVRARVARIPSVRAVDVSRSWPHTVRIAVTERVPVAVIDRGHGLQALDRAGVTFGHFSHPPAGLPLVRSSSGARADALAEAGKVAASLPPEVLRRVDHVDVATVDRIELRLHDGRTVMWGSAAQSAAKAEVLDVLLRRRHVQLIDVSVPGRPTTR